MIKKTSRTPAAGGSTRDPAAVGPPVAPRIARYESLAYGLFLHWGLYSLRGAGEWTMAHHHVPRAAYARLARRFAAEDWDPVALVRWAGAAGFRYICLTTRHHDGFSLYDTCGLNRFDAPHAAAGRDLVAPLAAACHAAGMGLFFYHTTLDWRHAEFDRDWDAYQHYLRDSVELLCTRYGRVDGFWFDGNWSRPDRDWQEDALYGVIRRHQPEAIIVNNSGIHARGAARHPEIDAVTFEQGAAGGHASPADRYRAREVCETFNHHWGLAVRDLAHKGPATVIERLAACRAHGANLLMNVGPLASGALPDYERSALEVVGRWIRDFAGEALYAGRPSGLEAAGRDFVLRCGQDWFYFAHDLPTATNEHLGGRGGPRTVVGRLPRVRRVSWTDSDEPLVHTQSRDCRRLTLDLGPHRYGSQSVVRVARISP